MKEHDQARRLATGSWLNDAASFVILQPRVRNWTSYLFGSRHGPYSPPCPLSFVLSLGEAMFHRFTVAIIAAGVGQPGANQLLVQHYVTVPHERQEAVVAIFAL